MKNKILYISYLVIGALLCIASFVAPQNERQLGQLSTLGLIFLVMGAARLLRLSRISRDPERMRAYEIARNDERAHYIARRAQQWTLWISIYAQLAVGLVLNYAAQTEVYQQVGQIICMFVCAELVFYTVLYYILNKLN